MSNPLPKPFGGAISQYFTEEAPSRIRKAIKKAERSDLVDPDYPYDEVIAKPVYQEAYAPLQIELMKLQAWVRDTGARVAILFEGRDAAGKGSSIKRFVENLNPRMTKVVALAKPSDVEQTQWYFQRYVEHLPAAGQIVLFDRSWYNRGVVEKVFGFCTDTQREQFFDQVGSFERMLIEDGVIMIKVWLSVSRAEQLRRFLKRESDPLRHWKLSDIDVQGLRMWDEYTTAIRETFARTHSSKTPWRVVLSDDKRRARLATLRLILNEIPYDHREVSPPDPKLTGGPELVHW